MQSENLPNLHEVADKTKKKVNIPDNEQQPSIIFSGTTICAWGSGKRMVELKLPTYRVLTLACK